MSEAISIYYIAVYILLILSKFLYEPASNEANIFCQTLNIAPGKAAIEEKNFIASATLNPEFCIPTSIAIVLRVLISYISLEEYIYFWK